MVQLVVISILPRYSMRRNRGGPRRVCWVSGLPLGGSQRSHGCGRATRTGPPRRSVLPRRHGADGYEFRAGLFERWPERCDEAYVGVPKPIRRAEMPGWCSWRPRRPWDLHSVSIIHPTPSFPALSFPLFPALSQCNRDSGQPRPWPSNIANHAPLLVTWFLDPRASHEPPVPAPYCFSDHPRDIPPNL